MFAPAVVAGWFSALFSCTTHTHTYLTHAPTNRGSLVLGLELDSRRRKNSRRHVCRARKCTLQSTHEY
ncbi:hypothetical protein CABS01_15039 [Colletotrichum abscissum]|uniref:uncharacterized protein n=1 Tax=Colletotrichum abscissum TaxID=1671311 RepID=UPI0027D61A58|nr:uncharacterized protein CABS01_15039 [Colletotrichum abscissum]KAK1477342.1 hypothetical protein CABS01_15039 [Colletotrichum abscissum]